jgi:putative Mn2+ efflux pump MntP
MDFFTLLLLACGLAMDAFAVSITSGLAIDRLKFEHAFKIAFSFGLFQAVMPVIGWLIGIGLRDWLIVIDHWIAFGTLSFIGGRMIYEAVRSDCTVKIIDALNLKVLFFLSVATSIDALIVGIGFAFLQILITRSVLIIGFVTFVISFLGVFLGHRFGCLFKDKAEIVGGLVLIAIGSKILIEHLMGMA